MKFTFILIFLFIVKNVIFGQAETQKNSVIYEPINKRYLVENKNAEFFIKYNYSDKKSSSDNYTYGITIVDSLLILEFYSPESDSYNFLSYKKMQILSISMIDSIKKIVVQSRLKQSIEGFPVIEGSAQTNENLFIKYGEIHIAGGLAYSNIVSFPDIEPLKQIKQKISEERRVSSSITGNYDLLITNLNLLFIDLNGLILDANR